jgi:uncharacterized protein YecE (DUF72 family)
VPSVELNTTFYNLPAQAQFEKWAGAVPSGFRFAVTMSRRVTARGRVEGVDAFEKSVRALGDSLGPIRIKVPQARDDGFLRLLLDSLDPEIHYALDFRHDSWADPYVDAALAERGMARVDELETGAPFRYVRLRDTPYGEAELASWAGRLRPVLAAGIDVYCYFRHEDEPTAPRYAEQLLELVDPRAG